MTHIRDHADHVLEYTEDASTTFRVPEVTATTDGDIPETTHLVVLGKSSDYGVNSSFLFCGTCRVAVDEGWEIDWDSYS